MRKTGTKPILPSDRPSRLTVCGRRISQDALNNPTGENIFKQLRLDMWVASLIRFIPEHIYDLGNEQKRSPPGY